MDTIDLPVLSITTALRIALEEMKAAKRSALVAPDGEACWLFRAPWVVWGIAARKETLADLEQRLPVHLASTTYDLAKAIDFSNPYSTQAAIEDLLDTVKRPYLMAASVSFGQMATIITRHESFKDDTDLGPADCYCTNPGRQDNPHSYSKPPDDRKCVYDGSRVECA
jgi:hypothetical protein